MAKLIVDDLELLRKNILMGIEQLNTLVSSTLGPRGQNVILQQKNAMPFITKDGVTVAKFTDLKDPLLNVGVQILKQASIQTNDDCGDGTTTATVLATSIYKSALKYLLTGISINEIIKGINAAVAIIIDELDKIATPIRDKEDITNIATVSANGDISIGKLIALAVEKVGKDGAITIEEAKSLETSLDFTEGFRFNSGYAAGAFITDKRRGVMKHDNPLILVTDAKIEHVKDIMPTLEIAARDGRPLIIIADEVEGQALAACIMNTVGGTMKVAVIKAPKYGNARRIIMKDMALSTGATYITREAGLELSKIQLKQLGSAKFIESYKNFTTIVGGKADYNEIKEQIFQLKIELQQTEDLQECETIQERITRLASGVAVIRVGGRTEVEMIEKKHRIEDALEAVKAAQEDGIVPGGGFTLMKLGRKQKLFQHFCEDEYSYGFKCGVDIIREAIEQPLHTILKNAGLNSEVIVQKSFEISKEKGEDIGYNVLEEKFVNLMESGIVDPCKVTKTALLNAKSVAAALLTTKCAVIEE